MREHHGDIAPPRAQPWLLQRAPVLCSLELRPPGDLVPSGLEGRGEGKAGPGSWRPGAIPSLGVSERGSPDCRLDPEGNHVAFLMKSPAGFLIKINSENKGHIWGWGGAVRTGPSSSPRTELDHEWRERNPEEPEGGSQRWGRAPCAPANREDGADGAALGAGWEARKFPLMFLLSSRSGRLGREREEEEAWGLGGSLWARGRGRGSPRAAPPSTSKCCS